MGIPTEPGFAHQRRPVIFSEGDYTPRRLWTVLFVTRHVTIAALAVGVVAIPDFGEERGWIAAALVLAVLPYDVGVHLYARRRQHLPVTMPLVYAPVPALFALLWPAVWVPALIAALGNVVLFSVMFDVFRAGASFLLSLAAFGAVLPIRDPDAGVVGLLGFGLVGPAVVVGVGALVEAFAVNEQRARDYLDNANDAVYSHTVDDLRFLSANEAALRLTGYTREELPRLTVADVVAPEDLPRVARAIAAGLAGNPATSRLELQIVTKDGRRVSVEVSARIVYRRGRPVVVQGIARDITERKQVEAQRAALHAAKAEFIANAAHELRSPLTSLAGLAAVLRANRDSITPEEMEDALEAIDRQGRRVQRLADQLLDLSEVELGAFEVRQEAVAVADVVEQALEDSPPPDGKTVEVRVPDTLRALTDPFRLQEILDNLLANAYRYGGEAVVVEALECDGEVVVTVADDGPGVEPALVPRLFEPFTRGDHGRSTDSTGLGLAICARLARALGGEVSYEPNRPRGARFSVRLPVAGKRS